MQARVRQLYHAGIVPLLEELFSEFVGDQEVVRLDRLHIDIGIIPIDRLEEVLLRQVEHTVHEELRACLAATEVGSDETRTRVRRVSSEISRLEAFVAFLERGRLPWWAGDAASFDPETELNELSRDLPKELLDRLGTATPEAAVRRLVRQVSPGALVALVRRSCPDAADGVLALRSVWSAAVRSLTGASAAGAAPELWIWEAVVTGIMMRDGRTPAAAALDALFERTDQMASPLAGEEVARAAAGVEGAVIAEPVQPAIRRLLHKRSRPQMAPKNSEEDVPSAGAHDSPRIVPANPEREGNAGQKKAPDQPAVLREPGGLAGSGDLGNEAARSAPTTGSSEERHQKEAAEGLPAEGAEASEAVVRPGPGPKGEVGTWGAASAAGCYVENAGLVLLWPYLKRFFSNVQLMEEGAFMDARAQERAVGLTQYAVTGTTGEAEHHAVLNKLLCGWPLDEPLQRLDELSEQEQRECETLLISVIDNWTALKKTSIEGFRSSFLQREGSLSENPRNWLMKVDRRGYDVLLERLPWGIGLVKQSWMEKPVSVQW